MSLRTNLFLAALLACGTVVAQDERTSLADRLADDYDLDFSGFSELRGGVRLQDDPHEEDTSIAEARLMLDFGKYMGGVSLRLKGELGGDMVGEEAIADLREANLSFSPSGKVDCKLGRQIVTWGTGDMLFINDVFPKDWESFFIGRDDEYLKKPSDALRVGLFTDAVNLDLVYEPRQNASRYIDGSRLSYWNGPLNRAAGEDAVFHDHERNRYFRDGDAALRLSRNAEGVEYAAYAYWGFWSTPEGLDPAAMKLVYPELSVYGGSVRGPLWGGISQFEFGYYDSREDRSGSDPLLRNSEIRLLLGHERELMRNLTCGLQYYLEHKQNYEGYLAGLPTGAPAGDENRHLLTLRLTQLLMQQNLRLSLFAYWSPSDHDGYLRPKVNYKITDQWAAESGANLFWGRHDYSFWGQFEDNSNFYAGLRRSF
ncbi:MAG: hypothetical protein HQL31_13565 [Planctomycetes bacterium]|nr:hypothetical protein [Planctomycetota bacterium]